MLEEVEQLVLGPVNVLYEHDKRTLRGRVPQELCPGILEAVAHRERVETAGHVEPERQPEDLAFAEPFEHPFRRIGLQQPEVFSQHLA